MIIIFKCALNFKNLAWEFSCIFFHAIHE